jgi:hypothetical protein
MTKTSYHSNECPSQEMLEKYAFDELSSKEAHTLERHVLNCSMCEDVIDGLKKFDSRDQYTTLVKKVQNRVQPKKKMPYLAIAAGLALLVGLSIFLSNDRNTEQLSENVSKKEPVTEDTITPSNAELQDAPALDDSIRVADGNETSPVQKEESSSATKEKSKVTVEKKNQIALALSKTYQTKDSHIANEESSAPDLELSKEPLAAADEVKAITDNGATIAREESEKPASKAKESTSEAISTDSFFETNQASVTYASPSMKANAETVAETKKRPTDKGMNELAKEQNLLSRAQSLMQQGKQEQALALLSKITANKNSMLYDEAQWKKVQCLQQLNRNEEAKKLLVEIATSTSKYSQQAKEQLK